MRPPDVSRFRPGSCAGEAEKRGNRPVHELAEIPLIRGLMAPFEPSRNPMVRRSIKCLWNN